MTKRTHIFSSIIVLAGLFLSGCGGVTLFGEAELAAPPSDRHPINVNADLVTLSLPVTYETLELTRLDEMRVRAFVSAYKRRGHGPLTISSPFGTLNSKAAINAVTEIAEIMDEEGLPHTASKMMAYRAGEDQDDAPVVLSFTRYVAEAPPCGNWTDRYTRNPKNLATPNFGCAAQHNLAVLVADPHDLIEPRGVTASDASRRDTVLGLYREGMPTGAMRDDSESAEISEVAED